VKILLNWQPTADETQRYLDALPGSTILTPAAADNGFSRFETNLRDVRPLLADVDAIVGWVLPEGSLAHCLNLKLLCWMHAGCDELDFVKLKSMGVRVANIRGANAGAVAEHAFALMLGSAKRLVAARRMLIEGETRPYFLDGERSAMLKARTLGVIGFGKIGSEVGRLGRAFGMRVLAVRRRVDEPAPDADAVYSPESLHEVLNQSDFVVVAAPMTSETVGLIGKREFEAMKTGAFLINVARGNLVQEAPLSAALDCGRLAGYAADVWWFYHNAYPATYHFPTPSRTGLHKRENVLGTPGQATNADGVVDRMIEQSIKSLTQFEAGERITCEVDLVLGY
jgi:phosphoglycerate dehydrogenase-like enzyme